MFEDIVKLATGGLDTIFSDLYKFASEEMKEKLNEHFSIRKMEGILSNIEQIGKVKTIFNPDSIVDLGDIYFNEAISFPDIGHVDRVTLFRHPKVLIEGGPGQGKSLYLKHICLSEACAGTLIPIFIEFRNLSFSQPIKIELMEAIQALGVDIDNDLFNYLAKSERLLFILDGFDEIPSEARLRTARELELIARTYSNLRILVSSRPDAGLGGSVYFHKFKIKDLDADAQERFVAHLFGCIDEALPVIKMIRNSDFISSVTRTPLLLTLFSITYKARQFKPDSISEFYSIIFPTMLYRHDRMKVGFERERKSDLSDYQMERVFEVFSYVSLKNGQARFSTKQFQEYIRTALDHERIDRPLEDLLIQDITMITALVVKDGYEVYAYTHKSIQEYFAAVFISRISDEAKANLLGHLVLNFNEYRNWNNVIAFLSKVDTYNYLRYFLLPIRKKVMGLDNNNSLHLTYSKLKQEIGSETKARVDENGRLLDIRWDDTYSSATFPEFTKSMRSGVNKYLKENRSVIANYLAFCDLSQYETYRYSQRTFIIGVLKFISDENLQKGLTRYVSNEIESGSLMNDIKRVEMEIERTARLNKLLTTF